MNHQRPINLDLTSFKYPPMAIVSILHRISGVVLFVCMPVMLYFLSLSLESETSFDALRVMLTHPLWKVFVWGFCSALLYHLLAGVRHMLMDYGWGESLASSRYSAISLLVASIIGVVCLGMWIC